MRILVTRSNTRTLPSVVVLTLVLLLITTASDVPASPDPMSAAACPELPYATVQANRDQYGPVVHLFGDSIAAGTALSFSEMDDGTLGCFVTPMSTVSLLLKGRTDAPYVFPEPRQAISGLGLPSLDLLSHLVSAGTIRPGDVVVVQDAGWHPDDPRDYMQALMDIRMATTAKLDVTLILMTVPEYISEERLQLMSELYDYRWNVDVQGMTFNEAITTSAREQISGEIGRTVLMDWRCHADALRNMLTQNYQIDLFQADGIHPNVLGQLHFVGLIFDTLGVPMTDTTPAQAAIARIPQFVDHPSRTTSTRWDANSAVAWAHRLLSRPRAC